MCGELVEKTFSNYRSLRKFVETLEHRGHKGDSAGKEVLVFTVNTVSEAVAHKGSSSFPLLFEFLLTLPTVCFCSIQVIYVAGTRMTAQGTDGLSRGEMLEGVLKGEQMLSFVPLHMSEWERESKLQG